MLLSLLLGNVYDDYGSDDVLMLLMIVDAVDFGAVVVMDGNDVDNADYIFTVLFLMMVMRGMILMMMLTM